MACAAPAPGEEAAPRPASPLAPPHALLPLQRLPHARAGTLCWTCRVHCWQSRLASTFRHVLHALVDSTASFFDVPCPQRRRWQTERTPSSTLQPTAQPPRQPPPPPLLPATPVAAPPALSRCSGCAGWRSPPCPRAQQPSLRSQKAGARPPPGAAAGAAAPSARAARPRRAAPLLPALASEACWWSSSMSSTPC